MATSSRCARTTIFAGSCLLVAVLASPSAALTFRTVAVTGDIAPDTGGATYLEFLPAVLNADEEVAFTATLAGAGVTSGNDLGMWSEGAGGIGTLAMIEREGSPAPGGGTWGVAAAPPVLNDAGQVAFRANTTSPSAFGVWSEGSGTLSAVAVAGNAAPGAAAGQLHASPFVLPSFNDAGQVAFSGGLSGPGVTPTNDAAIWAGGTGSLTMAARTGDAAPGAGDTWSSLGAPLINSGGDVAFSGALTGGGGGIWAGPTSGVSAAALEGGAAAGTGGVFANFTFGDFNDQGKVAFHAGLEVGTGGVTFGDDRAVFAGAPGALALVAREGDTAPGGGTFETFSGPLINDVGDVLFRGFLDSGTGLYLDDGAGLSKAVASGDAALGTDLGTGDATFAAFSDYALADSGAIAFEAILGGLAQGVTGDNDESLWLIDASGALELIVREGMLWSLGLDVPKIVDAIDFYGDSDAMGRGINDKGSVVFGLTFTDGTEGVWVVTPEPGTAVLLALGLVGVAARRREGRS